MQLNMNPQSLWKTYLNARQPTQQQPLNPEQVMNSAGGYTWAVDDWTRLDRFLILGTEGGTYYASQQALTFENAQAVARCVDGDGKRVVQRVVEISQGGRAPKNDPALFALALCAGLGDDETRQSALAALPNVARIGTHLFHFMAYVEQFRGWGRGLRRAVAKWYTAMPAERLAYQAIKYRQRDGWSHRDALRTQEAEIIDLVRNYKLPWEAVPTEWLGSQAVWEALLPDLPLTALLRNLGRMTANGAIAKKSENALMVAQRLTDADALQKARIHPVAILAALTTYGNGKGARGSLSWEPVNRIEKALDEAFYLSFRNVTPTGKRMLLALDVSGSMSLGAIAGVPGLTPRIGSAAMALITAATEPQHTIVAFSHEMVRLNISPKESLKTAIKAVSELPFGGTDCALPMQWALENGVEADAFVIYTDNETWFGNQHPVQALQTYRERTGIPAKLIVVGMVANQFTIADPNDGYEQHHSLHTANG